MELIALIKKIDELKELMIASNVTNIEINRCRQWKGNNDDEFVDNFETSIHQDDLDRPWNRPRDYVGYSRRG